MRKLRPGRFGSPLPRLIAAFGGYEKLDARGRDQHLPDSILKHPIGVRDPFAQVHELQPQLDKVSFLIAPEIAGVLEDSPRERAVAAPFEPEFVQSAHKCNAILGVDPVLDLDQDRPTIVVDLLTGLRQAPMLGGREVQRGSLLQLPSPGEGDRRGSPLRRR